MLERNRESNRKEHGRCNKEHKKLSELAARGAHVAVIGAGYVGVSRRYQQ